VSHKTKDVAPSDIKTTTLLPTPCGHNASRRQCTYNGPLRLAQTTMGSPN
jgi:hypothetical protein